MSLDQLLDDNYESPKWTAERRRMIRFFVGAGIIILGMLVGFILISSIGGQDPVLAQKNEGEEGKSKALAELMRVRDQTESLRQDLEQMNARSARRIQSAGGGVNAGGATNERTQPVNYNPGEGFINLQANKGDLYLPTGSVFRAQLLTPIKTSVERTFVMAEVTNDFRMDSKRYIPAGSRLIGRSRLNPILKGVIVEFETLVLPNGIETSISALALSRNALPEIDGLYFSDRAVTYGTAMAFGFLSGFADSARSREISVWGAYPEVSLSNQTLAGLSTASFQVANEILSDIRASAIEYVVVPAGERVFVALTRRYDMNQKGQK